MSCSHTAAWTGGPVSGSGAASARLRMTTGHRAAAPASSAGDPGGWLLTAIETQIIPRLMLAHRSDEALAARRLAVAPVVLPETAVELARLVMVHDSAVSDAFIDDLVARGAGTETLLLELIAPAARVLGRMWEEDRCNFVDVTLGLTGLHRLVRVLSGREMGGALAGVGRRILLMPVPGEQHRLGVAVLDSLFTLAGWDVASEPVDSLADAADRVGSDWVDVIGLSISAARHALSLRPTVATLRAASQNPDVMILIGGPYVADNPDAVAEAQADATALDGRAAVAIATALVCRQVVPAVARSAASADRRFDG